MKLTLNIDQIVAEAEAFGSPYDTDSAEALNAMEYNGTRVLNQLRAVKYTIDADEGSEYAFKAVRVFACIKHIENMLAVIEDVRSERV